MTFPDEVTRFFASMEVSITLGVNLGLKATPLECLGLIGYRAEMLFWIITPLTVVLLILLVTTVVQLRLRGSGTTASSVLLAAAPSSLKFLFLVYPIVTKQAFDAFSFHVFDQGRPDEESYLRVDVRIERSTAAYTEAATTAITAILMYPVGLIVLYAGLLFCARDAILNGRPTQLSKAIVFLHGEYEVGFFWWELVEMSRRLVLVGVLITVRQGSIEQLAYGSLASLIFLACQLFAAPYRDVWDNFFAAANSLLLSIVFLTSTIYKYGALTQLNDLQGIMSIEQQDNYNPPFVTLSLVLFGASAGSFVILAFICLVLAIKERQRLRLEKHAALARRLRYVHNSSYVEPAPLPDWPTYLIPKSKCPPRQPGPFHIFLSHSWAHGQDQMRIVKTRLREMIPEVEVFLDVDALGNTKLRDFDHVDVSNVVLVYLTMGFFKSGPCAREIVRAILLGKPIIAVLETDRAKGGLTEDECRAIIATPWDENPNHQFGEKEAGTTWFTEKKWRAGTFFLLEEQAAIWAKEWGKPDLKVPTSGEVANAIFKLPPINWYPLSDLQDVSTRLIAQSVLPESKVAMKTYMEGEVAQTIKLKPIRLHPLRFGRRFHLYCSPNNLGASSVGEQLQTIVADIELTTDFDQLLECDRMLIHLRENTWTSAESAALAREVAAAMREGINLLLLHEVQSGRSGDNAQRAACPFARLFEVTPKHLLAAGVYNSMIALNLAGDEWRQTGLIRAAQRIAEGSGVRQEIDVPEPGVDDLDQTAEPLTPTPVSALMGAQHSNRSVLSMPVSPQPLHEWRGLGSVFPQWARIHPELASSTQSTPIETDPSIHNDSLQSLEQGTAGIHARELSRLPAPAPPTSALHKGRTAPAFSHDAMEAMEHLLEEVRQDVVRKGYGLSEPETLSRLLEVITGAIPEARHLSKSQDGTRLATAHEQADSAEHEEVQSAAPPPLQRALRGSGAVPYAQAAVSSAPSRREQIVAVYAPWRENVLPPRQLVSTRQQPLQAAQIGGIAIEKGATATSPLQHKMAQRAKNMQAARAAYTARTCAPVLGQPAAPTLAAPVLGRVPSRRAPTLPVAPPQVALPPLDDSESLMAPPPLEREMKRAALIVQGSFRRRRMQRQVRREYGNNVERLWELGILSPTIKECSGRLSESAFNSTESILRRWTSASRHDEDSSTRLSLSTTEAATRTQFDDFFASAEGGVLGGIDAFILNRRPIEEGWEGGGGVRLCVWDVYDKDSVHEIDVVAGAAHRWHGSRSRKMSVGHQAIRRMSTLATSSSGADAALAAAAAIPDDDDEP